MLTQPLVVILVISVYR